MTLEAYARQREAQGKPPELTQDQSKTAPQGNYSQLAKAQKIIAEHELSHEIAEGCRLQMLQCIERKENPYKIILLAAEAIGRLDFMGDAFYLQMQSKLIEAHGRDVSEDNA